MSRNLTIQLDNDLVEDIVYKDLSLLLRYAEENLEAGDVAVHSYDEEEERKQLNKDIKALKRVLRMYKVP